MADTKVTITLKPDEYRFMREQLEIRRNVCTVKAKEAPGTVGREARLNAMKLSNLLERI